MWFVRFLKTPNLINPDNRWVEISIVKIDTGFGNFDRVKIDTRGELYIVKIDIGDVKFDTVLILKVSNLTHFVSILTLSYSTVKFAALHMIDYIINYYIASGQVYICTRV